MLASPLAMFLSTSVMPDPMALAFYCLSLVAFLEFLDSRRRAWLLAATASLALAALTKPTALNLGTDLAHTDVWADTTKAGVTARPGITIRYTGNANAADDLATAAPVNGIINYPDHIQPIWTRDRGANTCTRNGTSRTSRDT